jgi:Dolichyl-phosphate-mannose-protein mannosyltransferase
VTGGGRSQTRAPRTIRPWVACLAVGLSVWTDFRVLVGQPHGAVLSWLASLVTLVLAAPRSPAQARRPGSASAPRRAAALAVICLPALVRVAGFGLDRVHGDDMLTAYFSATYDLAHRDFFAPVPADPADWVSQFPSPFFVLQKLFFLAFGESLLTVKLSTLPYVLATSALLFAIARELLDERAAVLALAVYAFFGPSLYLETLGLHFISSAAVFLAFFYFALREFRGGETRFAVLAGLSAGACYLFYLSSFLALPLAALFFLLGAVDKRGRRIGSNLLLFALGVAAMLGPFLADGLVVPGYFLRRFDQVSLLDGEWSPFRREARGDASALGILWQNLRLSVHALYQPGIGGQGGYDFARRELLEPVALILVTLGFLRAVLLARRHPEWWLLLLGVCGSFLGGLVLTIPPPAFHRFSIAFPLLSLLMALPLHAVLTGPRGSAAFRRVVTAALLCGLITTQLIYFQSTTLPERGSTPLRLASFINHRFPGRALYVAAFPAFAFEKIYRFVPGRTASRVVSDYHAQLLRTFDPGERYVYLITLPKDFDAAFEQRDPHGRIIRFSPEYSLFVN